MKITRLGLLEYYIAFAGNHSALSNRYAAQAEAGGSIYGVRINGAYAGFLCVSDEITAVRITNAFTLPEYRKQGVFTELVKYVTETQKKNVRAGISNDHPCYMFILNTLLKLGFLPAFHRIQTEYGRGGMSPRPYCSEVAHCGAGVSGGVVLRSALRPGVPGLRAARRRQGIHFTVP